jgi:DNA primase
MSQIDEVRDKIDIVELIGSLGVALRKTGRSYVGFCPFHPNSRTPAFHVYPDNQSYHCFGCQAHGTAFDFVMAKQGLDFRAALELLAARAGVKLEPRTDEARQEDARRTKLLEINAAAARYFNYILTTMRRGEPARDYVAKRAISAEMVEQFQLGYSLDEWSHCLAYLVDKKGFAAEDVEAAGLAINHESRGRYDRFRGRLIFPIRNAKGEIVGFGGRALGDGQPKYLNTPETLLYKKGDLLYGLDLAREAIRTEDRTVVVEGYVDVITAHQHGFRNVVAPLGTALTKSHVALLKRLSHNVFMALDADAAGQKATLRGLSALRDSAGEDGRLVATAQGAVRLESDVALRIIRMPEGRDPDEVIKADPELWKRLVTEAVPVMEFYLGAYTAGLDLKSPTDQNTALERLLPLLAELDGAQQRVYVSRVEQVVGIRAELIIDLLRGNVAGAQRLWGKGAKGERGAPGDRKGKGRRPGDPEPRRQGAWEVPAPPPDDAPHPAEAYAAPGAAPRRPAADLRRSPEAYLLSLALRHTTVDAAVEALLEEGLAGHPAMRELFGGGVEDLLEDPVNQAIWAQISVLPLEWRPSTPEDLAAWAATLDAPLRERAEQLIAGVGSRPDDYRYRQEAEHCARTIRVDQARALQRRLLQRLADEPGSDHVDTLAQLNAVTEFLASATTPRRSSTFPDLRDVLGKQ